MATKTNTIIIERKSAWCGALMSMHVVIDYIKDISLSNGESTKITVPQSKTECTVQAENYVFKVVNLKKVKKIVFKWGGNGIGCSILYSDGNVVNAINTNPTAGLGFIGF